ncbi:hypothetical protein SAY87_001322 [Trapa incisa]|uniref:Homeobox domain-containing protein n=1 Tax=Trapa incisa TaxID=236973 RepID=A0AAN7GDF3_9MYRT|nr:hypothetical protein SAY87_001322 [Trapa incisa]
MLFTVVVVMDDGDGGGGCDVLWKSTVSAAMANTPFQVYQCLIPSMSWPNTCTCDGRTAIHLQFFSIEEIQSLECGSPRLQFARCVLFFPAWLILLVLYPGSHSIWKKKRDSVYLPRMNDFEDKRLPEKYTESNHLKGDAWITYHPKSCREERRNKITNHRKDERKSLPVDSLTSLRRTHHVSYQRDPSVMPPALAPSTAGNNVVFLNSATSSLASHPQTGHHLVGIPLHRGPVVAGDPSVPSSSTFHHEMSSPYNSLASRLRRSHWNPTDSTESTTPRSQQGLSLSLSSRQLPREVCDRDAIAPLRSRALSVDDVPVSSYGLSSAATLNSKYLKPAQQLLEEVVNVMHGIMPEEDKMEKEGDRKMAVQESGDGKSTSELTAAERHEVQLKKTKLMTMADEVEQRYMLYHNQIQIVVASFEQATGNGSARPYTTLALKTISKKFRCLRDAIARQIKVTSRSLGEEAESSPQGKLQGSLSRLKFVDHRFRQQQALQHLGLVPQGRNTGWRPQRGLPEQAVSVLRAWLFEHFLHPYPKDADKQLLAKQTGLTRGQVSNWFINARVRLWKPMVEEMYLEEAKENPEHKVNHHDNEVLESVNKKPRRSQFHHSPSMEADDDKTRWLPHTGSYNYPMVRNSDLQASFHGGFEQYQIEDQMGRLGEGQRLMAGARFPRNGVSLTLGLPHCENLSIAAAGVAHQHQNFLPAPGIRLDEQNQIHRISSSGLNPNPSAAAFDGVSIQSDNQKRFTAAQQMPESWHDQGLV